MADHYCGYVIEWPETQDDKFVRCGKPAPLKRDGRFWFCAEHFDEIESMVGEDG